MVGYSYGRVDEIALLGRWASVAAHEQERTIGCS
jgi:hypothetical protein